MRCHWQRILLHFKLKRSMAYQETICWHAFFLEKCQERLTRSHQLVFEDSRRAPSCWGQALLTALCWQGLGVLHTSTNELVREPRINSHTYHVMNVTPGPGEKCTLVIAYGFPPQLELLAITLPLLRTCSTIAT